jgi:hypothetical protein
MLFLYDQLGVKPLHVGDQRRPLGKRFATLLALEGPETSVRDLMALEGGIRDKRFLALIALHLNAKVAVPVKKYGEARVKAFVTAVTPEALLVLVAIQVHSQEIGCRESASTDAA